MFPVSFDRSMLRRLTPAGLAVLGLVTLVLTMPSFSAASAQTVKPKYRLKVSISGVPSKITLDKQYTYTIRIKNTGRLKLKKVTVRYWNGTYVPNLPAGFKRIPGPTGASQEIRGTLTNLKAGATKRIAITAVYDDPMMVLPNNGERVYVRAIGSPGGRAEKQKIAWY